MGTIIFTHLWVDDFGWENTVFNSDDFDSVEYLGKTDDGYDVYLCIQSNGKKRFCSITT